ncbi:hypothetical protein Salat_2439800 [Sesamum alatum]|uniref:Reverse transcriptase zinc-binding domain-containing protein n=1 Tax=Sesamum alatum TaxID=300844 RepID=A0AAE1XZ29_9LAMI|nr:hypothetical protein Salat_2439800 [Sesamum alatum]
MVVRILGEVIGCSSPAEVRLQAWKLCFGAVPMLENLACRRPGIDTHCSLCGAEVESLRHVLLECPFARQAWAISNLPWRWVASWNNETAAWMSGVLQKLDHSEAARFLTLCWALWQNRNKKVMEGKLQDP